MEFHEQTLDNGLQVIAECNPNAYSTALGFFVRTGARDETAEVSGVSHFLEHMTFKGTPNRSADDVNRELDEIGSHSNAYTSEEQTVYYAVVLPELQDRAMDLLCDIMRPSLREDDFNIEKNVILEEIAKYEDQPPFLAPEKCMADHFREHPLSKSVLGTVESVSALSAEQMRDYFERRYSPGNIVLTACGRVDFDGLVGEADRLCGSWKPFDVSRQTSRAPSNNGFRVIEKASANQEYAIQICNGPAAEDLDRYASRMAATILGDDSGSRLFWELVDTGLAEYASIGAYEFQGTGIIMTFVCSAPEDMAANLQRLHDIQIEAEADGVTEAELTRAKSKICSHVVLQSEKSASRLFSVGVNWLQRNEYRTVREVVDAYRAVTCQDVAELLRNYPLSVNTTVAIGPLSELASPK